MTKLVDGMLRKIFPYRLLAWARQTQLRSIDSMHYYERADRRVFFYRAFCLLRKNGITGDYAEFGCNGGMTFVLAYQNSQKFSRTDLPRKFWAFDSFQGLPPQQDARDEHPEWVEGWLKTTEDEFVRICTNAEVPRSAYETVPGFYEDTVGKNAKRPPKNLPQDVALVYIDCDLYSSTESVLEFLAPRLKHGMIIALDDYYCYSSTQAAGERAALLDFFKGVQDKYCLLPYVQYGYAGMSFILEERKFINQPSLQIMSH